MATATTDVRRESSPGPLGLTFGRILFPIDYSDTARLALRTALAMREAMGSEVHLFHLAEVGADDRFIASIGGSASTPAELVEQSKARLRRFVEHVCPNQPSAVSVHAEQGAEVVEGIEHVAKKVGATLILLARGPRDSVFRTLAEKVARQFEGAVLLV